MTRADLLKAMAHGVIHKFPDAMITYSAMNALIVAADAIIAAQPEPEPEPMTEPMPVLDAIPGWEAA